MGLMRARLQPKSLERARRLRQKATDEEKKLWRKLREMNRNLGCKFRRQVPFRSYILDFVEHGAKLVIEIDGSQHGLAERATRDGARDRLLAGEGYKVLRFWNRVVNEHFDAVVGKILLELQQRRLPSPSPPPCGEVETPQRSVGVSGRGSVVPKRPSPYPARKPRADLPTRGR